MTDRFPEGSRVVVVRKEPPARDRVGNFCYHAGSRGTVLRTTEAGIPVVRFTTKHVSLVNPSELELDLGEAA